MTPLTAERLITIIGMAFGALGFGLGIASIMLSLIAKALSK